MQLKLRRGRKKARNNFAKLSYHDVVIIGKLAEINNGKK